jgi:D-beta-D-heptose 7-phosphate kinase/D-beta-D-heptose 1-phosphate adenosyltransferase
MTANIDISNINFNTAKILVVGDVMLDQYWHGATLRISPEAPVPVVKINKTDNRAGGAANVANNLIALGCSVKLLGAIGKDSAGDTLVQLLKSNNVSHDLIKLDNFSTIIKLRVMSQHQQMIRLDHEDDVKNISPDNIKLIYDAFASEVSQYKTIVLSDYAKGVLINPRPYIEVANAFGIPVIVDPKNNDFSIYKGAYLVKPNLLEFEKIVGKCSSLEDIEQKGRSLIERCGIANLVVTRGAEGVSLIPANGAATHLAARSGEVYDVTGAGDTVIAVLAASVSSNVDLATAAYISTIAAGLVVSKVGTSSVSLQEVKKSLNKPKELPLGVMTEEVLRDVIKISQSMGEKVVFVNGCYDIIHYGHIRYLESARALGDRLVIGVNSDASVKRLKGEGRPMYTQQQRMQVLASLKAVDWVVTFEENTPGRLVESLNPNIMAKGDEHFKSIDEIPNTEGVEHVLRNGGAVHLISRTPDCSSSKMIEFMEQS